MKLIRSIASAVVLALAALPAMAQTANLPEAVAYAQTMGVGWNLGNNLDAHIDGVSVETGWGNPAATQKLFNNLKKAGFGCVRIPVTWMGHIGPAPAYHIEKAWLDRVAEVASYAKKAGLKAIINVHHDGFGAETDPARQGYFWLDLPAAAKDEKVNTEIKQKLAMVWMQIATRFQNEGDWLIFETLNEIQDGKWGGGANNTDGGHQYRVLNEWNQLCVDVIRSTGGQNASRYIGIPGYVAQPGLTIKYLAIPEDEVPNRLMVAVHIYDPWDYAGSAKYSEWGHTGKDVVPDKAGEKEYTAILDALYTRFVRRGIPVYLGEYGCVHRNNAKAEEFRKYYLEYTCKALRDHKMPVIVWDNGKRAYGEEAFGLMTHDDGKFISNSAEIVKIMIDAWNNNDPAYTLQSIWDRAPEAK
ncbi:MAG: glycoside hydrolase family 5 protein [Bacteroidales bacterium]|nr:glycoside hydrolase family 5 protein [Candidatus Cryptobacteroides equifaecalis]